MPGWLASFTGLVESLVAVKGERDAEGPIGFL